MNELTIHDYLQKKGLNEYGIAGLMGNLFAESGLNPRNLQNSYENVLGMNDNAYVAAVDNGTYTNFVQDKAGFGLAQWTFWTRKQALLDFAKASGKSIGDLIMQLDFLWKELSGSYPGVLAVLRAHRLEPKRLAFVKNRPDAAPWLFLVEAQKNRRTGLRIEPDVLITAGAAMYGSAAPAVKR